MTSCSSVTTAVRCWFSPVEAGRAWDFENNGMVDSIAHLINDGRVKVYCVDSLDDETWSHRGLPIEERALRHEVYTRWLTHSVVPYIHSDTTARAPNSITVGCSMGAYHAVHFAFQRADLAPLAIGLSGNYDVNSWRSWGERGDATYFANPTDYVPNLHGDHLEWLRGRLSILLVVGQGAWETHPTGSLPSTVTFAALVQEKGIRCELDLWGYRRQPRLGMVAAAAGPSSAAILLRTLGPRSLVPFNGSELSHTEQMVIEGRGAKEKKRVGEALPCRTAAGRRGGLAAGFEALCSRLGVFEYAGENTYSIPNACTSLRSTCATRPGIRSSSTVWPTGTTTRESG